MAPKPLNIQSRGTPLLDFIIGLVLTATLSTHDTQAGHNVVDSHTVVVHEVDSLLRPVVFVHFPYYDPAENSVSI